MRGSIQRSAVSGQRGGLAFALTALIVLNSPARAFTVQHGRLSVTYSDPRDRAYVPVVFAAVEAALRDLRARQVPVPDQVAVVAAANAADFARRTGEPVNIAASTLGSTIRTQRLGALAARGLLPVTIRHETFHAAQPPGFERWKAEGLARLFSGEAGQDGAGPTGLAGLTDAQLDAALTGRTPARLTAAYHEASRRAARLLARLGWARVLRSP